LAGTYEGLTHADRPRLIDLIVADGDDRAGATVKKRRTYFLGRQDFRCPIERVSFADSAHVERQIGAVEADSPRLRIDGDRGELAKGRGHIEVTFGSIPGVATDLEYAQDFEINTDRTMGGLAVDPRQLAPWVEPREQALDP